LVTVTAAFHSFYRFCLSTLDHSPDATYVNVSLCLHLLKFAHQLIDARGVKIDYHCQAVRIA